MDRQRSSTPIRRLAALGVAAAVAAITTVQIAGAGPAGAATNCSRSPHLTGSFMQPWLGDGWTGTDWTQELNYLKNACITTQIIQYAVEDGQAYYPSGIYTQVSSTDVVDDALANAGNLGMKTYIGLSNDSSWFTSTPTQTWLNNAATATNALADDLWADYGGWGSFGGWFIPYEVDNVRFTTSTQWTQLGNFFATIANHLHQISPGKPVVIAPFYNTHTGQTSAQWQSMWTSILRLAPVDVLALQDGVGACDSGQQHHATTAQLPTWFAATKNAISAARPATKLYSDNETFDECNNSVPLSISTVVADMKAVQPYVSALWSFSYDHYDSPKQGHSAQNTSYLKYLNTGTP